MKSTQKGVYYHYDLKYFLVYDFDAKREFGASSIKYAFIVCYCKPGVDNMWAQGCFAVGKI